MRILAPTSPLRAPVALQLSLLAAAMVSTPLLAQNALVAAAESAGATAAALAAVGGAGPQAQEQTMGDQPPQQIPSAPAPAAAATTFELKRVVFKGATQVGTAELEALASDRIGRQVGFEDLREIARRATALYHARGYYLAQAILPEQEVIDGVVEISVVEGLLGRVSIEVDPLAPISEERVRAMLSDLQPGEPLHREKYERAMLLLSDLPGLRVQSAIEEGASAGSTDLVVQVAAGDRLMGSAELDNYGTRETGRERLGGTLRWASPLKFGDNLDLRAMVSSGEGTLFGRIAYELPLGYDGLRLGMGVSRVSYSLGEEFEVLDAVGTARIYDLALNYPLIRQRGHNLFLRGFVDRKDLTDELRAVDFEAEKRIDGIGIGWAWERRDGFGGGGYWSSSGALYHGRLKLLDAASRAVDQSIFGRNTAGDFNKLTVQVSRLQALTQRSSLFVGLGAQLADRNLDASEKLALGGYRAVRAYPSSEVLVDNGAIANIELRYALTAELTVLAFYDAARGEFNDKPGPFDGDNKRSLHGPGIGLNYAKPGNFSANLSVAWRTSDPALSDGGDRQPRVFLQLQKSF